MAWLRCSGEGSGSSKTLGYVYPSMQYATNTQTFSHNKTVDFEEGYLISYHGGNGTHYVRINDMDAANDPSINILGTGGAKISKIKRGDVITAYGSPNNNYGGCVVWLAYLELNKTITDFYCRSDFSSSGNGWNIGDNECPFDGMGIEFNKGGAPKINGVDWTGINNNEGHPYNDFILSQYNVDTGISIKEVHSGDNLTCNVSGIQYGANGVALCCLKYR